MKIVFLILGGVAALFAISVFFRLLGPPDNLGAKPAGSSPKIVFDVSQGMGIERIASELKKENLIRSTAVFKIYSLLTGMAHSLKPGRYTFESPKSVPDIVKMLWIGPKDIVLTIIPGMTLKEVDDRLAALGVIKSGDLGSVVFGSWLGESPNNSSGSILTKVAESPILLSKGEYGPEGFLLPDTYNISSTADAKAILQKFLDNFRDKALPFFSARQQLFRFLIIASILEKEAPGDYDRQIIAGILEKRIKAGMPLQIDATIVYAKCDGRFLGCGQLAQPDYKIDSRYNTYLYQGLPPGPISNPGLSAIRSALNPQKSEYWFYLSDSKTKQTIFAKTLDEQNKNRVKYLLNR